MHRRALGTPPESIKSDTCGADRRRDPIGAAMTKDAYTKVDKAKDEILLVAGDSDYEPVITDLKAEGYKVEVAFWDHASGEIKKLVDPGFISLNARPSS